MLQLMQFFVLFCFDLNRDLALIASAAKLLKCCRVLDVLHPCDVKRKGAKVKAYLIYFPITTKLELYAFE